MIKKYTGDFETTTDLNDCRVWSWGVCDIDNVDNITFGLEIDSFFEWCEMQGSTDIYFHNEKFDGEFMLSWLFKNGFKWCKEAKEERTFSTLISNMGQWYALEICWNVKCTTTKTGKTKKEKQRTIIYDSLKKYPFPVKEIAEAFNFPIKKGEIDYTKERPIGYNPTEDEWDYLKNDIQIMAMALKIQFDQGLTRMTRGSDALGDYKDWLKTTHGKSTFKQWFPVLSLGFDKDLRKAYKGGFTWVNKVFQGKEIGEGIVFDVNSLYPSQMYVRPLPYGTPLFYEGEYKDNIDYPLYIQNIKVRFRLKERHIPTIQVKQSSLFIQNEYLESSVNKLGVDELIDLTLTNVDLDLFFEHYDILEIHYTYGYMFKASCDMFKGWIDKWIEVKNTTEGARKANAKGMLNSLYGKFGTNPDITGKVPYMGEDGIVRLTLGEEELRDPVYVPLASFVTAWGRYTTITTAQRCFDNIIYCDTDSIHLTGTEVPEAIEHLVDSKKLGYWKHESTFQRAKFIRQKTYVEEIDGELNVKCAGMPDRIKELVTFDNFEVGFSSYGKLLPKRTQGGVVLVDTMFTIK